MTLAWVREPRPVWDADKQRVIGGAPEGAFVLPFAKGDDLPGEWFSVQDDGAVVGYGRLDIGWGGDAEILLAVDPGRQEQGVGSFLLDHLEQEAAGRGINYVRNTIRDHEGRDLVHDWLVVRGFRGAVDGDLRKRVVSRLAGAPGDEARQPTPTQPYDVPEGHYRALPGVGPGSDLAPGHEEQGGYVDVDDHRF